MARKRKDEQAQVEQEPGEGLSIGAGETGEDLGADLEAAPGDDTQLSQGSGQTGEDMPD